MQNNIHRRNPITGRFLRNTPQSTREFIDELITGKVRLALALDRQVNVGGIAIDTRNSMVQLSGMVRSESERDRALELAQAVSGVVSVRNDLCLK